MAEINLERLIKAPWTIDHESIVEAILADIADIVPLIGELAGIVRILYALERKDDFRVLAEIGDLLAGIPPSAGDVLDILTPTNLICYLKKQGKL
jgi:hypothetical protein